MGTCGIGNGAEDVFQAFLSAIEATRRRGPAITRVGCFGFCAEEALVNVAIPGKPLVVLNRVKAAATWTRSSRRRSHEAPSIRPAPCARSNPGITSPASSTTARASRRSRTGTTSTFYKGQKKIVLRNCGLIDPEDIEEYIAVGGYKALLKTLRNGEPERVIEELKMAKLRGRGGAGFLVGTKWEFMRNAPKVRQKYVICNADEGDPGAYMNRNEIESDPHALIEGMIIGAYVHGRHRGHRLRPSRVSAGRPPAGKGHRPGAGLRSVWARTSWGRGFSFNGYSLVEGAGAFVCGEETALIASLEGKAGRPRPRPPYPAAKGLWGKPTNINNVETWYNVPVIVNNGGGWFTQTGTERSPGTKVFSLVGKIKNTGLVEVPLGTSLKTFVYDIGGGTGNGKAVKALQTGGPSGGCVPVDMFDTPVDYEALAQLGSIMGSGGMVVHRRRQLHGRRRPLLHRVHPFGILRQVRTVPGRPRPEPAGAQRRDHGQRPASPTSTCSRTWGR